MPIRTEHRKDRAIAHAALWILGSAALSLLSFVCFLLGFNFTTTAFILLVAIVLLSLLGSFASAAIFSAVAVGSLVFLFVDPAFAADNLQDTVALVAFLVTSLVIANLVSRLRVEDALRRSQAAYLAEAQKLSHTGSFGWNVASGELFWSDETFRIFDVDPASPPSLGLVLKRTHPDDLNAVREAIDHAVKDRNDFSQEYRLVLSDGSIRHIRVVARGMTDGQGQFEYVGAVMDITAQKKANTELERSELRYRHLFGRMPIALRQLDASRLVVLFRKLRAEGIKDLGSYFDNHPDFLRTCMDALSFQEANERAIQMFGGGVDGYVGRSMSDTWKARPDTFRRAMESRFRGETNFEEETKMVTWDGRVVDVLFTTARVGPINDLEISLVATIDISQRVRAQERLRQVQAEFAHAARVSMLGELTASIAHEVNQPLAAIATNAAAGLRWLNRPIPDMAEVRSTIENMATDTRRAADIVARVHGMASRKAPERAVLSLDDVIREALLFLRHEMESRGVTILHRPDTEAALVLGDRTQLQQVIVNLAINAVQAMTQAGRDHGRIVITTAVQDATTLCCSVEDNGPGISAEHAGRLFESFFTTKESGMGMGLPICRSIVEAHGGRIDAEGLSAEGLGAEGLGAGARFWFTLPIATPASSPPSGRDADA
ncbi:ATP-binding protein [Bradyrhizobium japonicum]|uniref:ATP-binding protein n=1 Tax=Bradyrhizobium japonicum TaxID=375 RepID=UPI000576830D|nr:ATP-binding protein [Bradyrhizobium japonicum]MCP1767393.1 PAS domain S-box-containing protein [Bradyrhizobium japonicum]MCP1789532.1 PAS domain S-box-containing protein [Bradyrhizobium japonicum]MCP1802031.1 PAS domain S-box-containing protein [Bradyrhizobium japonicum]MCP1820341.1 PAS domain S-box-containing protein [Bradyrhizobium japonicum]MCP1868150.1 PAS domain S-box-containing protein [Bradyrhizobium japonicum]